MSMINFASFVSKAKRRASHIGSFTCVSPPSLEDLGAAKAVISRANTAIYQAFYAKGYVAHGNASDYNPVKVSWDCSYICEILGVKKFSAITPEELLGKFELLLEALAAGKKKDDRFCCCLAEEEFCVCDYKYRCPVHAPQGCCTGSHD